MISAFLQRKSLRFAIFSFALAFHSSSQSLADKNESRPNIIYINVDDLGWTDLGCQGSMYYETPNIDALANQGMRFTNAYAPASNCAPSRACCITGQYTPRHGVYTVNKSDRGAAKHRKLVPTKNTLSIKSENQTIASVLQSVGYRTCSIGKWHISQDPELHGFAKNIAGDEHGHPTGGGYFSPFSYPNCVETESGVNLTDRLTDEAIQFLKASQQQPFFLYLPYYAVHTPIQPKQELLHKYNNKTKTPAHDNAPYAAMIENLDTNIGRVLQKLDELNLAKKTLVLFTSDNGGLWRISKQWPLRAGKGSYYEGGIRVPLIVRWPGKVSTGTVESSPVSGIDFLPTLAEVAGTTLAANKPFDGKSILPLLNRSAEMPERPLFWHFPIYLQGRSKLKETETRDSRFRTRPGSVIRHGKWKLHEYFEDGGLELYDLETDISEKNNLAAAHPKVTSDLQRKLRSWRQEMHAPVPQTLNPKYQGHRD